jgi:7,8-dihydroneopterin aldolase/epimerase/oxygenase
MTRDTIALEGLEFFAYHGFYPEERKIGNRFGVDITVSANLVGAAVEDKLKQTVNYEELYHLVKEEMHSPAKLLEHLAYNIMHQVFAHFPSVEAVRVSVSKFNPPIGGVGRAATVTMQRQRHELGQ